MTNKNNPTYEDVVWTVEDRTVPIKGIDEPKIVSDIEIEGWGSWGASSAIKRFHFTSWSWVQSFEWFWFQPSHYVIQAWNTGNSDYGSNSYWTFIDWTTQTFYLKRRQGSEIESDYNTGQFKTTSNVIVIYSDADDLTSASHHWFTSDWIELDWTDWWVNVFFTITAYA